MKKTTLLAAALLGLAGYQSAQAIPTVTSTYQILGAYNQTVQFTFGATDIPSGAINIYSGTEIDGSLFGLGGTTGILTTDITPPPPEPIGIASVGDHRFFLSFTLAGVDYVYFGDSFTLDVPIDGWYHGYDPSHPPVVTPSVPDAGASFSLAGMAFASLAVARKFIA